MDEHFAGRLGALEGEMRGLRTDIADIGADVKKLLLNEAAREAVAGARAGQEAADGKRKERRAHIVTAIIASLVTGILSLFKP